MYKILLVQFHKATMELSRLRLRAAAHLVA